MVEARGFMKKLTMKKGESFIYYYSVMACQAFGQSWVNIHRNAWIGCKWPCATCNGTCSQKLGLIPTKL